MTKPAVDYSGDMTDAEYALLRRRVAAQLRGQTFVILDSYDPSEIGKTIKFP